MSAESTRSAEDPESDHIEPAGAKSAGPELPGVKSAGPELPGLKSAGLELPGVKSAGLELRGRLVILRPVTEADVSALASIRNTPEVRARWRGGPDLAAEIRESIMDKELGYLAIVLPDADAGPGPGAVAGAIQWSEENEPDYRHASIDVFVDPSRHNRGVGTDAVRALAAYLVDGQGFHRLVIDPAADNEVAIRCYAKVGFRPVGIMRQYELGPDGTWHDGLLMDLLAAELVR